MLERISRRERYDLIIAWFAISIALSLAFSGGIGVWMGSPLPQTTLGPYLVYLVLSMITVGVGFVLHELAHKFTAMRYGYWAEYRKDNLMLLKNYDENIATAGFPRKPDGSPLAARLSLRQSTNSGRPISLRQTIARSCRHRFHSHTITPILRAPRTYSL